MLNNYHTHTVFCDGADTPEEIVLKAIELGCKEIGFSGHSYTEFDTCYCMSPEKLEEYKKTVLSLKEKYKDKIKVLLGIEVDYYSDIDTTDFDYIIGSVHYVKKNGQYLSVDHSKELFVKNVTEYYNGDYYAFMEDYFKTVANVYNKTKCDIIGHFDLIRKFNGDGEFLDESCERYKTAVLGALSSLLKAPCVFEFNTGAISRGYKGITYPSNDVLKILKKLKKKVIFSSDCHNKEYLLFGQELYKNVKNDVAL